VETKRAKVKWIKDSDSNSEYFHFVASTRHNNNYIKQIKDREGRLTEEQSNIERIFFKYFQEKWIHYKKINNL